MIWYSTGTVTMTNGSPIVTGAGTAFLDNRVQAGHAHYAPDGRFYPIKSVDSNTQLTLDVNYLGATAAGAPYMIVPTRGMDVEILSRLSALLQDYEGVRDTVGEGLFADGSAAAPGFRFLNDQDTGVFRPNPNSFGIVTGGVARAVFTSGGLSLGDGATDQVLDIRSAAGSGGGVRYRRGATPHVFIGDIASAIGSGLGAVIYTYGPDPIRFHTGGIEKARLENDGTFRPGADNSQPLGAGSYRWSVVYAGTGSINTSDEDEKDDIGAIPDAWLDAWGDVEWCRYRFRDAIADKGDGARWHVGLIAQRVRDAFAARDLDATEIGLLCRDEWDAAPAVAASPATLGPDGETLVPPRPAQPARPAGARWGLRYDECQAMEAAWQRRELARLRVMIGAQNG